jgi:peptidoglycan/LPS O-acetylase OafA/YrhL
MFLRGRDLSNSRLQIDSLDGLRGLAVLLVFLSHTSNQGFFLFPFLNFAGIGKEGVYLFFMLSAFLLTIPFLEEGKAAFKLAPLTNYFVRRFFRIYPLYIIFLVFCFVSGNYLWILLGISKPIGIPYILSPNQVYEHIFLIQGVGVSWSILVEFRFYFVLPLVAFLYAVIFRNNIYLSVCTTLLLVTLSHFLWPKDDPVFYPSILCPYIGIFFLGCGLASLHHYSKTSPLMNLRKVRILIDFAAVVAVLGLIYLIPAVTNLLTDRNVPLDYYHKEYLLLGGLWGLVLFACVNGFGVFRWFFELPLLRYLGFISFSLYFFHTTSVALIKYFMPQIPFAAWWMLIVGVCISHVTWFYIERPTAKIRFKQKPHIYYS